MHDLLYPQVGNFTLALLGSFNLALTAVSVSVGLQRLAPCSGGSGG